MRTQVLAGLLSVILLCPCASLAQTTSTLVPAVLPAPMVQPPAGQKFDAPRAESFWAPFKAVPGDFVRFFSPATLKIVTIAGASALVANRVDDNVKAGAIEHLRPLVEAFEPGNMGGGFVMQTAGAFGTYAIGRIVKSPKVSALGGDLLRAQILSQGIVQGVKYATQRQRPDGEDYLSFPSGHTASAFATASVLKNHFGWKVGAPAYAFGSYVALSRISSNKHHLSDVMMGAAVGIASAYSVNVGTSRHMFSVGIAPTVGGAAVTFTKK